MNFPAMHAHAEKKVVNEMETKELAITKLKEETNSEEKEKLQPLINSIVKIKTSYNLNPGQNRYVDRITRERMKLQIPKRPKRLPDYLNPAEVYQIIQTAYQKDRLDGMLVQFLILTGLRVNEARNLMIQDLDFNNDQLKVVQGKGLKDRYVPLHIDLARSLRQFIGERSRGYLFAKENEKQYTVRALQKKVEKAIASSQFSKKLSTHSLRHTFACICLSKGMPIEHIQLLMGHSSVKTTEIYARIELGPVKEKFLQMFGG